MGSVLEVEVEVEVEVKLTPYYRDVGRISLNDRNTHVFV